ncbi:MAG: FIST signal transduction protein [Pirellulaceae bacterium]
MSSSSQFRFASALSTQSDLAEALEQVCESALGQLQATPHLAVLFVGSEYGSLDDGLAARVSARLSAGMLWGGTAEAIVGRGQEIEGQPAVSLWLAHMENVRLIPMHLQLERTPEGASIIGWPDQLSERWPDHATMLTIGDPFSFPADLMVERLNEDRPDLCVVGGMTSGAAAPGESRLFLGREVHSAGAVAIMLDGPLTTTTVVSQGCRPIGNHLIVTKSEGNLVQELGGKPALLQLKSIFDTLATTEQQLVQRGLHLGRVVNEYKDRFTQGDFLVRNVIGIDPDSGSIAVGDFFRPGQTVQFHVRDHHTADEEMRQMLASCRQDAQRSPVAGLLFTCNGRGSRLFPAPHHDAQVVREYLGDIPLAGFFAAGEIGPIGGKNFMHGFTASLVLFEPARQP